MCTYKQGEKITIFERRKQLQDFVACVCFKFMRPDLQLILGRFVLQFIKFVSSFHQFCLGIVSRRTGLLPMKQGIYHDGTLFSSPFGSPYLDCVNDLCLPLWPGRHEDGLGPKDARVGALLQGTWQDRLGDVIHAYKVAGFWKECASNLSRVVVWSFWKWMFPSTPHVRHVSRSVYWLTCHNFLLLVCRMTLVDYEGSNESKIPLLKFDGNPDSGGLPKRHLDLSIRAIDGRKIEINLRQLSYVPAFFWQTGILPPFFPPRLSQTTDTTSVFTLISP